MADRPTKWHIRPATESDYEQWSALYHGYRSFYKQPPSDEVVNTVWSWIHDEHHVTQALVAVSDSGVIGGLAHHRRWPRPLMGTTGLYLDDLFTRPDFRGHGIATLLIQALSDMAKEQGLNVVRWTTAQDNATARRVYDSVASATTRVTYDKEAEMADRPTKWHIRPATESDYEQWSALYHGYRSFYKQPPSDEVVNTVWSWIHDEHHVTQALVAVSDSGVIGGLAHHRRWPRPLMGTTGLYLDDLFTRPDFRGHGIATLLIQALSDMAKEQGLNVVRWTTAQDNATARRVYDSVASATTWVTYDKVPGSGGSEQ